MSDKVGRNALEQLQFRLQRDLRDMERIEQKHPNLLAPGLFFAWHRHRKLKEACQRYAAEIGRLTGKTAQEVLSYTIATMEHARPAGFDEQADADEQSAMALALLADLRLSSTQNYAARQTWFTGAELEEDSGDEYPII